MCEQILESLFLFLNNISFKYNDPIYNNTVFEEEREEINGNRKLKKYILDKNDDY